MSSSLINVLRSTPTTAGDVADLLGEQSQSNLLHVLAVVPDPRHRRGVRYRLASLLTVAVCAVLALGVQR